VRRLIKKKEVKMPFTNEEEMLQAMVEVIEQSTGLVLDQNHVKELLLEVQREQLKGLVYRAFMAVNQTKESQPQEELLEKVAEEDKDGTGG
jgi:hypothetical protein